jgi:hypothetical protein
MKNFILLTLSLVTLNSFADCSIYSEQPVPAKLRKLIKERGYDFTEDAEAPYQLTLEQDKIPDLFLYISGNRGQAIFGEIGTTTVFEISRKGKFFHQAVGEAINIFADADYRVTNANKKRSARRAYRDMKRRLKFCPDKA